MTLQASHWLIHPLSDTRTLRKCPGLHESTVLFPEGGTLSIHLSIARLSGYYAVPSLTLEELLLLFFNGFGDLWLNRLCLPSNI